MFMEWENEYFEKFWAAYPKKVAKDKARVAFWKSFVGENTLISMLSWIEKAKRSRQWADSQFIPHPTTFLNQKRWEGDVPEPLPLPKRDTIGLNTCECEMSDEYKAAIKAKADQLFGWATGK
jgi:hypothetical protein